MGLIVRRTTWGVGMAFVGSAWMTVGCGGPGAGDGPGGPGLDAGLDPRLADGAVEPDPIEPAPDGGEGDPGITGPLVWESVEALTATDGVICERVSYDSEGLIVEGQVCRPDDEGIYPIVMYNHGGAAGIGSWGGGRPKQIAAHGYAVFASSYRGEDNSEGVVEVCEGEVIDILRMYQIAKAQPYADATRTAVVGESHGGCNTMRVLARGEAFDAAVSVFGVVNWVDAYQSLQSLTLIPDVLELRDVIVAGMGGTPTEVPEAWETRSPITYADVLADVDVPLLILQGELDPLVTAESQCAFVRALGGFEAWRVSALGVPSGCHGIPWQVGAAPTTTFSGERTLLMYPFETHLYSNTMVQRTVAFLHDKLGEN